MADFTKSLVRGNTIMYTVHKEAYETALRNVKEKLDACVNDMVLPNGRQFKYITLEDYEKVMNELLNLD